METLEPSTPMRPSRMYGWITSSMQSTYSTTPVQSTYSRHATPVQSTYSKHDTPFQSTYSRHATPFQSTYSKHATPFQPTYSLQDTFSVHQFTPGHTRSILLTGNIEALSSSRPTCSPPIRSKTLYSLSDHLLLPRYSLSPHTHSKKHSLIISHHR